MVVVYYMGYWCAIWLVRCCLADALLMLVELVYNEWVFGSVVVVVVRGWLV